MAQIIVEPTRDLDLAATLLAESFADDPMIRWMVPDPRHDRLMFRTILRWTRSASAPLDIAYRDGVPVGVATWEQPGHRVPAWSQFAAMPGFVWSMRQHARKGVVAEESLAQYRDKGNWYLGEVGAIVQGAGVGTTLLRHGLERTSGPVYLESTKEVNIPLYERFGFQVTGTVVLPDGPTVWPMRRDG